MCVIKMSHYIKKQPMMKILSTNFFSTNFIIFSLCVGPKKKKKKKKKIGRKK